MVLSCIIMVLILQCMHCMHMSPLRFFSLPLHFMFLHFLFFYSTTQLKFFANCFNRVNMMLCLFLLHALIIHAQPKLYSCFEDLFNKTFFLINASGENLSTERPALCKARKRVQHEPYNTGIQLLLRFYDCPT